jgi:hypothetical protein
LIQKTFSAKALAATSHGQQDFSNSSLCGLDFICYRNSLQQQWHNSCLIQLQKIDMQVQTTEQKYQELILKAQASGVMNLYVRELNNILYIDGQIPSDKVKEELWMLYHQIDPEFRSGDLVLNLKSAQQPVS